MFQNITHVFGQKKILLTCGGGAGGGCLYDALHLIVLFRQGHVLKLLLRLRNKFCKFFKCKPHIVSLLLHC